jgi:hypothetical protein
MFPLLWICTIENLTTQLCAYERALASKNENDDQAPESSAEALLVHKIKQLYKKRNRSFKCNYCGEEGHGVKKCSKWHADEHIKITEGNQCGPSAD